MGCDSENHQKHMCALKRQGLDDCIQALSDRPTVECRSCGSKANSSKNLCAAHLMDTAPPVEGGHGSVPIEEVGKPHEGEPKGGTESTAAAESDAGRETIVTKELPVDGVCGGY